ncbi:MAG: cyclically-permuted mutarotase family protein [Bacteroidetes bacterium]|nr:cyclically-permuted mutarotase family protein [Bacteroidota bacterium]
MNLRLRFFILIFALPFLGFAQSDYQNNFTWQESVEIPPPAGAEKQHGLASPFAGTSGDVVIVAGGCNFPNVPVVDGGTKKYYNDAFVLVEAEGKPRWLFGMKIPNETAYGASVNVADGLLCIGGNNNDEIFNTVYLLKWNKKKSELEIENWPELPFPVTQMGAALVDNIVYVVGGKTDGKLANTFLSLDISKKGTGEFQWKVLDDFPGVARLQPVVVTQNAAEEKHLFLFSGSSFPDNQAEPSITTDGLEYNPKLNEWTKIVEIAPVGHQPFSLHGASGLPLGMNHVLFVGGVNNDKFYDAWKQERIGKLAIEIGDTAEVNQFKTWKKEYLSHEPVWYKFNKEVLVYHTLTNSWTVGDEYPFVAPVGAKMVAWKDGWLVINGETMPGVRSAKVYYGELKANPKFGWINWLLLISYLGGMLYLGYFFMKRENGTEDFFKGGGRIPWWAAGMSIFATMLSAITFMAIPAKAFATDWKYFPMAIAILIMAFPVVKYYLPFFRRLNVTTAYEYLERRFNYTTRFLASFLFIIFMIARMALVLFLPSLALTTVTGIDIYTCIVLMGVITIIYCTMGGVEAVVWGDVIQGFVLLSGAVVAVFFLISGTEGGMGKLIEISMDNHKFTMFDFALSWKSATIWVILLGGLANNLISYSADQTVIQRYLTTKDEKSAAKGIMLNGVLAVIVSVIFYFIGTALYVYYKTHPEELNFVMQNTDSIFPHFIMSKMPVGVAGLLIAAIFSATMSTVSSNVNSLSTAFTSDFYCHFFPGSTDKKQLSVARWSGIVFGGIGVGFALLMATLNILSLFDYFNYILGLLASGLGALFLMGIFFPRINGKSALIGFVLGTGFLFLVKAQTDISFLLFGFIGMAATLFFGLIFSFFFKNEKEIKGLTWKTIEK